MRLYEKLLLLGGILNNCGIRTDRVGILITIRSMRIPSIGPSKFFCKVHKIRFES